MSANQQVLLGTGKGEVVGQQLILISTDWVCPAGVTSVSVVCVGYGGDGGLYAPGSGGGALAYRNNITVIPGQSYPISISPSSSNAFGVIAGAGSAATVSAAGAGGVPSGTYTAGFQGGSGGARATDSGGGGGGAGGYAGNGGTGGDGSSGSYAGNGAAGSGGGGGGGAGGASNTTVGQGRDGGNGGGVGLLGQGANGFGGISDYEGPGGAGGAGSGGSGTNYGGGASGRRPSGGTQKFAGQGAVRIIWPGNLRQFPSTRTADE